MDSTTAEKSKEEVNNLESMVKGGKMGILVMRGKYVPAINIAIEYDFPPDTVMSAVLASQKI